METMKFNREMYSKVALLKAAYNYTDIAYLHLDADEKYFYVTFEPKRKDIEINCSEFVNEMLAQSVRHEIYTQTKNIRELMFARALATSVLETVPSGEEIELPESEFNEDEILKDWFETDENT